MKTSVIVPTHNRARYLELALQSILDQSLSPFEIIVIDDGSTEDIAAVAQAFGPTVRYFRQEHSGVSAARNHGLEAVRCDLIAWLDSDDLWEPDFLKTTVSKLKTEPDLGGVYTGLSRIDSEGNPLPQTSQKVVPPSELYSSLVEYCNIQTSTFVARKECFEQAGRFDTNFDICEDYDMFLRLVKVCKIAGIPQPLVRYRIHSQNTVGDPSAFCRFRLALTEKHFGKPEGNPDTWPDEKRRAHAFAFNAAALKCIENAQPDEGWRYMERAFLTWPSLANRLGTFYELACSDQPSGCRGHVAGLDIERNGAEMLQRLDGLFTKSEPDLESVRPNAYGNAYLALAILSDQASQWSSARRYMLKAIGANPQLLTSYPVFRRGAKLFVGQGLVKLGSRMRKGDQTSSPETDEISSA